MLNLKSIFYTYMYTVTRLFIRLAVTTAISVSFLFEEVKKS